MRGGRSCPGHLGSIARHGARPDLSCVPPQWRHWLLDRGSLTQRLTDLSNGNFNVQVVQQCWQRPRLSEAKKLGIKPSRLALVREVLLKGNEQPWVFARSLFPLSTVSGRLRHLRQLDNRPLGRLLFRHPGMRRTPFEFALLESQRIEAIAQIIPPRFLWRRRSLFYIYNQPILVTEIFLPALEAAVYSLRL